MQKVIYENEVYLYKNTTNFNKYKEIIIDECIEIIKNKPDVEFDNYDYFHKYNDLTFLGKIQIKSKLDKILDFGIKQCLEVYNIEYNLPFNRIDVDCWINRIRAKNPVQFQGIVSDSHRYHTHTELEKKRGIFTPHFTWVYYIQMPDNLEGDDGTLFLKGKNGKEYFILPEEGDFIVMPADLPHSPQWALKSIKDRIVLAGNVGFEFIKNKKSLI
jgi:hypothetical protein